MMRKRALNPALALKWAQAAHAQYLNFDRISEYKHVADALAV
jgi:hypothetical protein